MQAFAFQPVRHESGIFRFMGKFEQQAIDNSLLKPFIWWTFMGNFVENNLVHYSVLFNFGHIRRWDQCAVFIFYLSR